MLRRIARPFILFSVIAGLFACTPAEDPVDYEATVVPRSSTVSSGDGSVFVTITAKGEWSIELEYPAGGPSDWATMDPASGTGSQGDARLRYSENTEKTERSVTLVLKSLGVKVNTATVYQQGKDGTSPSELGDGAFPAKWLELPETKAGDGRVVLAHDMSGQRYLNSTQSGVRNWSCYWDYNEHLSIWVAYPLNKALIGSGNRTNAWGLDPMLPSNMQPDLRGGSYGGGWTRGHQIPSADRLNYAANVSTFYGTNMTPQDYDFNSYIWANLEGRIRSYASTADTLYVVTGCVLEGSHQSSGSSSGFRVKVPAAYFKAVLQKSTSSAIGHKGYRAAAFYLPHDTTISRGNFLDYLISVDELESRTGIDFFVNLPGVLGKSEADAIEAETPSWAR
ncbi:MAG: DNA/RNA non-specific endonuclease [Bacteroidales bacterium]|nr:DNA/RNA non-specific endonuclease [Bacteroidales bacterium]